ncbi:FlgO family outer membrane protein [Desulfurivibrio dismutans]|uniref:FlgO family outer membrane protein n=1 Tax=Desulfurivibrio dismutans TaxID=1398908 RepID=UPI0023DB2010|nr:FlgO family outer membrane protein [Desulfurivibrio alkaliphilus]MDF1613974.1 FlgO family outer membrane protein [Desulfurivibrio alkaliphilus]
MTEKVSSVAGRWLCIHVLALLLLLPGQAACAGQQPVAVAEKSALHTEQQPSYFVPQLEARPIVAGTVENREPRALFPYRPTGPGGPGLATLLGEITREAAGKVFYQLREDSVDPSDVRVAVVGAVPLADLKRESEFGRVLAEFMLTDLADRGVSVTELRLGKDIHIVPQTGEFVLSRNIGELASRQQDLDYVVLSTYSNTRSTLMLHGRLVGLQDGLVRTSWRHNLPLDRELRWFFGESEQPVTVSIRGML